MKPGRPKVLDKTILAAKCYKIYWEKGINNVTYNDAIKYSGFSKFSFYKVFKNEDELHKETIKFYFDNYLNNIKNDIYEYNNVLKALSYFEKKSSVKNYKPCFFNICNSKKNELGTKAKKILKKIEISYKKMFIDLINRHIKEYNLDNCKINVEDLSAFLVHNFYLINILMLNKTSTKEILIIKRYIKEIVTNELNYKKKDINHEI